MKPIGRATGSDHRGRERVLLRSARTARNRRTRTRMYGGVGGGRGNPPADPIRRGDHVLSGEVSITEIPRARSVSQPIKHAKPQITNSDAKKTGGDTRHTPL